jgi:hypothetical protein
VVITLACFFILLARLRVQWAPGFPCALCSFEGEGFCTARAKSRRENADVCPNVIASEAKQSIAPRKERMDCFARNDESNWLFDNQIETPGPRKGAAR